jgi:hypothetical protein
MEKNIVISNPKENLIGKPVTVIVKAYSANINGFSFQMNEDKGLDERRNKDYVNLINTSGSRIFYKVLNSTRTNEIKNKLDNVKETDLPVDNTPNINSEKIVKIKVEKDSNPIQTP